MKKGDRVKLSKQGQRVAFYKKDRVGTVHGYSNDGFPRVTWDGNKGAESWHPDFLELAPDETPTDRAAKPVAPKG